MMVKKGVTHGKESKVVKAKLTASGRKPNENGRISKRSASTSQVAAASRSQRPPRSTAGFSLYSSDSELEEKGLVRTSSKSKSASGEAVKKAGPLSKTHISGGEDVVSQMQVVEDRVAAGQAADGIIIPTAGIDSPLERSYLRDEELFEVSTPFNKRLISSTPDPERLAEAELMEQEERSLRVRSQSQGAWQHENPGLQLSQRAELPPQMIPERDTGQAASASAKEKNFDGAVATDASPRGTVGVVDKSERLGDAAKSGRVVPLMGLVSQMLPDGLTSELYDRLRQQRQQHQASRSDAENSAHGLWEQQLHMYRKENSNSVTQGSSLVSDAKSGQVSFLKVEGGAKDSLNLVADRFVDPSIRAEWVMEVSDSSGQSSNASSTSVQSANLYQHSKGERSWDILKMNSASDIRTVKTFGQPQRHESSIVKQKMALDNSRSAKSSPRPLTKEIQRSSQRNTSSRSSVQSTTEQTGGKSKSKVTGKPQTASASTPDTSSNSAPLQKSNSQSRKAILQKSRPPQSNAVLKVSGSKVRPPERQVDPRGEDVPPSCSPSEVDSVYHSASHHTASPHSKASDKGLHVSAFKPISSEDTAVGSSVQKFQEDIIPPFNLSADTCDEEVSRAISKGEVNCEMQNQQVNGHLATPARSDTSSSDGNNLSQVIELLKTEAFAVRKDRGPVAQVTDDDERAESAGKCERDQAEDTGRGGASSEEDRDSGMASNLQSPGRKLQATREKEVPRPEEKTDYCLNESAENYKLHSVTNADDASGAQQKSNSASGDPGDQGGNENNNNRKESENDVNQNCNDDPSLTPQRPRNLEYLDKMADPYLRDVACRLAFKAAAIRDVELRDLIDDMIFHTDAALAHEDARFHSSQMFFAEENSKLKKRVHNVNRQLEAKERQERMGGNILGTSNNDVLHLERKCMYLQQEKDRLDSQVTNLLQEKAQWLMTQQDLVRTISMKDHEILKLEEKQQAERMRLHQALDQATKNSQGIHYKLSVADREIANLEQRMKAKDAEIGELKDKLLKGEKDLSLCEEKSKEKGREIERLENLVDTLKLGVNQVLRAYEGSADGGGPTEHQRRGMESLRLMAHPELLRDAEDNPPRQHVQSRNNFPTHVAHGRPSGNKSRPRPEISDRRLDPHDSRFDRFMDDGRRDWSRRQESHEAFRHRRRHSGGSTADFEHRGRYLTSQALEEHNRQLSPFDRSLWRSWNEGPVAPLPAGQEPYFSDSEIVVNNRDSRRRSAHRDREEVYHDLQHDSLSRRRSHKSQDMSSGRHLSQASHSGRRLFDHSGARDSQRDLQEEFENRTSDEGWQGERVEKFSRSWDGSRRRGDQVQRRVDGFSERQHVERRGSESDKRIGNGQFEEFDDGEYHSLPSRETASQQMPARDVKFHSAPSRGATSYRTPAARDVKYNSVPSRGAALRQGPVHDGQFRSVPQRENVFPEALQHDAKFHSVPLRGMRDKEKDRLHHSAPDRLDKQDRSKWRDLSQSLPNRHVEFVEDVNDAYEADSATLESQTLSRCVSEQSEGSEQQSLLHDPRLSGQVTLDTTKDSGSLHAQNRFTVEGHQSDKHAKYSSSKPPSSPGRNVSQRHSSSFPEAAVHDTVPSSTQKKSFSSLNPMSFSRTSTDQVKLTGNRSGKSDDLSASFPTVSNDKPGFSDSGDARDATARSLGHYQSHHHDDASRSGHDEELKFMSLRSEPASYTHSDHEDSGKCRGSHKEHSSQQQISHASSSRSPKSSGQSGKRDFLSASYPSMSKAQFYPGDRGGAGQLSTRSVGGSHFQQHRDAKLSGYDDNDPKFMTLRSEPAGHTYNDHEYSSRREHSREDRGGQQNTPHTSSKRSSKSHPRHSSTQANPVPAVRTFRLQDDTEESRHSRGNVVTFQDPDEEIDDIFTSVAPEFGSALLSGRSSVPNQSSPVRLSDISLSRRATLGSENVSQRDFFQGTELSASLSSISDTEVQQGQGRNNNNNDGNSSFDGDSFSTGIATLDAKIAKLQAKINHTKAVFS
ncbi:uncharacterized protein LOC101863379 [Aplysia californica]|uniref:Uncharacterized protein LOC101863379 n=1 Tax=Aplysia californica TaxID=6500 RepID=A0ABM0K4Y6_APLCA|nr:uncharacterized protein LOC101863379 [Aplysia californica]